MKKITTLLVFSFFFTTINIAQNAQLKGTVTDTLNKQNLPNTVIALLKAKDSVLVKFVRSDKSGNFEMKNLPAGKFFLMISYPAYADFIYPVTLPEDTSADIGIVKMTLKSKLLQEVLVKQKVAAVRMKGDTVEYNADSFKVHAGASVEEMLRKMPGMQVDKDGNITAQGTKVEKVLVDGEEFFGDDPTMATKNLQADAIEKVQVFDKKSDQAAFTGIDDGTKKKTLNLTLKEDKKKGHFGKVELGSDFKDRWNNSVMINSFKSKRKLSIYGIMSSTGKTGLSWDERGKYGESGNMDYDEDGGYWFSSGGDDEFDSYGSFRGQGLPTGWSGGAQYSKKYNNDKQNLNGSYKYNRLNTVGGGNTVSQSILPGNVFYNKESSSALSRKQRHAINGTYEWQIDSFTSIKIKANGFIGDQNIFTTYNSESLDNFGNRIESRSSTFAEGDNSSLNSNFLLRHRFKKAGRTISLAFDEQNRSTSSTGFLNSINGFYDKAALKNIDTIDQKKINDIINTGYYSRVAYTEPIVKNVFLELSYGIRISNSESKKLSYDRNLSGKYENLNDSFSNNYKFNVLTNSGGMAWRYNSKKTTASAGGDIARANFKQTDLLRNTDTKYNYTNFFPKANFNYKFNATSSVGFNYNGNTRPPSIEQIQPVRDNTNPLNIAIGNPDLKQEFMHQFNLNFNSYKVLKQRGFYTYASFSSTSNSISTNETTIISGDSAGIRTYRYVNLNGNYNGYSGGGYNFKVPKLDLTLSFGFNINVNRYNNIVSTLNNNILNSIKNRTDNNSYGLTFQTYKSKEKKYDINYYGNVSYNSSKSTVNPNLKTNYYTHSHNLYFNVTLPKRFELNTNVEANFRQKTNLFTANNNVILWNAYIGKKMFKNDKGMISIRANDILDQNRGYNRFVNSNILREESYQTLRRYFLLTYTWNFSKNPGGAASPTP
ncbi:MAG TPA: outer membrane beta-barrel family protein [Segetibacter sp.]|nr:outer membrane beta-barrel family protein [Segetibacter sp.]